MEHQDEEAVTNDSLTYGKIISKYFEANLLAKVELIPLSKLLFGHWRPLRKDAAFANLQKSFDLNGFMSNNPFIVFGPNKDGKYTILSGKHRFAILQDKGSHYNVTEVPALVLPSSVDSVSKDIVAHGANQEHDEFSLYETDYEVYLRVVSLLCKPLYYTLNKGINYSLIQKHFVSFFFDAPIGVF